MNMPLNPRGWSYLFAAGLALATPNGLWNMLNQLADPERPPLIELYAKFIRTLKQIHLANVPTALSESVRSHATHVSTDKQGAYYMDTIKVAPSQIGEFRDMDLEEVLGHMSRAVSLEIDGSASESAITTLMKIIRELSDYSSATSGSGHGLGMQWSPLLSLDYNAQKISPKVAVECRNVESKDSTVLHVPNIQDLGQSAHDVTDGMLTDLLESLEGEPLDDEGVSGDNTRHGVRGLFLICNLHPDAYGPINPGVEGYLPKVPTEAGQDKEKDALKRAIQTVLRHRNRSERTNSYYTMLSQGEVAASRVTARALRFPVLSEALAETLLKNLGAVKQETIGDPRGTIAMAGLINRYTGEPLSPYGHGLMMWAESGGLGFKEILKFLTKGGKKVAGIAVDLAKEFLLNNQPRAEKEIKKLAGRTLDSLFQHGKRGSANIFSLPTVQ
jgi:hypothetical protein